MSSIVREWVKGESGEKHLASVLVIGEGREKTIFCDCNNFSHNGSLLVRSFYPSWKFLKQIIVFPIFIVFFNFSNIFVLTPTVKLRGLVSNMVLL